MLTSPIKQGASPSCLLLPRSAKARFRCLTGQPLAVDDLRSGVQRAYEVFLSGSFLVCSCEYSSRFMCPEHTGTLLPPTLIVVTV